MKWRTSMGFTGRPRVLVHTEPERFLVCREKSLLEMMMEEERYIRWKQLKAYRNRGVAVLKVDPDVKLWTRSATGPGYQIDGLRDTTDSRKCPIIRAKLDEAWVCPRKLNGRKVFYRAYRSQDCSGNWRWYVFIAARSDDAPYTGRRILVISKQGVVPFLEPPLMMELRELYREWAAGAWRCFEPQPYEDYGDFLEILA